MEYLKVSSRQSFCQTSSLLLVACPSQHKCLLFGRILLEACVQFMLKVLFKYSTEKDIALGCHKK